jgi:hypothetical protein
VARLPATLRNCRTRLRLRLIRPRMAGATASNPASGGAATVGQGRSNIRSAASGSRAWRLSKKVVAFRFPRRHRAKNFLSIYPLTRFPETGSFPRHRIVALSPSATRRNHFVWGGS